MWRWRCWWWKENNRNVAVAVVVVEGKQQKCSGGGGGGGKKQQKCGGADDVLSFTIHEAVLKKVECKVNVVSMWSRCKVDRRSMYLWMERSGVHS